MSYDITLNEPVTNKPIMLDDVHFMQGGTYCLNGTKEAWLNITWNYSKFYYNVFGDMGIREIYGKTGAESIPILKDAISKLKNDKTEDYWESTEGNAKVPLYQLLAFAQMRPDGVWEGD